MKPKKSNRLLEGYRLYSSRAKPVFPSNQEVCYFRVWDTITYGIVKTDKAGQGRNIGTVIITPGESENDRFLVDTLEETLKSGRPLTFQDMGLWDHDQTGDWKYNINNWVLTDYEWLKDTDHDDWIRYTVIGKSLAIHFGYSISEMSEMESI